MKSFKLGSLILIVLFFFQCNYIVGQTKLNVEFSPSVSYNFKVGTNSILKKNIFDIGLASYFRWDRGKVIDYNMLISLDYPTNGKDSLANLTFVSFMPGLRYAIKKNGFINLNIGLTSDIDFKSNGLGVKVGYSKFINLNRKDQVGLNLNYYSIGSFGIQIYYLFRLPF